MIIKQLQAKFKENMTFADPFSWLSQFEGVLGVWGDVTFQQLGVSNVLFPLYSEICNTPDEYLDFRVITIPNPLYVPPEVMQANRLSNLNKNKL